MEFFVKKNHKIVEENFFEYYNYINIRKMEKKKCQFFMYQQLTLLVVE